MAENIEELPKSKSQVKRELHELQELGKILVSLPNKQLAKIPVSEQLRDEITMAKSFKHGALSRQLKHIGRLMPREDVATIRLALDNVQQPHKEEVNAFREVELWRDRLLEGDQDLVNELELKYENFERQHVSQLLRNAKKENELNKPPKSARLLFKHLASVQKN